MHPIKHLKVILKHRHKVIIHCFRAGIFWQGLKHDLSKFSPEEFMAGARYYQGTRSPNEREREKTGYSLAWMHHKGRNKHHFEYWTDYDFNTKIMTPMPMPKKYIVEMFCDRVAASKVYMGKEYDDKKPIEYFLRAKNRRRIEQTTADKLEEWLVILAEKGEKEAFTQIRLELKEDKQKKQSNLKNKENS